MSEIRITFDELVAHGVASGAPIINGMPWSFDWQGQPVTHENDDCYLIGSLRVERGDVLVADEKGGIDVRTATEETRL